MDETLAFSELGEGAKLIATIGLATKFNHNLRTTENQDQNTLKCETGNAMKLYLQHIMMSSYKA